MSVATESVLKTFNLESATIREINSYLHSLTEEETGEGVVEILSPAGAHNIACGLTQPIAVHVAGHVGYYCGGMNQRASITIDGLAGTGVGENMMSGRIEVRGNASQCAAASAHGGLLVVGGNAASRCGISLKGGDIVVKGNAGTMTAFLAQSGNIVVCGDVGEHFGDSIYEARLYVKGQVASLGTDCVEKEMRDEHLNQLSALLEAAGCDDDPADFRRYGSARQLYHFKVDNAASY